MIIIKNLTSLDLHKRLIEEKLKQFWIIAKITLSDAVVKEHLQTQNGGSEKTRKSNKNKQTNNLQNPTLRKLNTGWNESSLLIGSIKRSGRANIFLFPAVRPHCEIYK
jgi:hypothetical protein